MTPELGRRVAFTLGALKLSAAGLFPIVAAGWLLSLLLLVCYFFVGANDQIWPSILGQLSPGRPLSIVYAALAVVTFALLYVASILDPDQLARKLKAYDGFIVGVPPGEAMAGHVDYILSRMTIVGGIYLAGAVLVPELVVAYAHVPFYLGGMPLLIVVCAVLDLRSQLATIR